MKSTLTNGVGCEGWMSELPDNVLLSKLSIPGTRLCQNVGTTSFIF